MVNGAGPFVFHTERRLVLLTGLSARNLPQLAERLHSVSGSSIFYHTHHQFLARHFEKPLFHNDFATWVARALLEGRLSERLAAIDVLAFPSIRQLREALISVVEGHLAESARPPREAPSDDEFHFCESQSFFMPTGLVANDAREFLERIPAVSNESLFFHFFEARLRLERPANDFSLWLHSLGEKEVADRIDRLDPYSMTLDELRGEIVRIGEAGHGR